jgi:response regulator RpfG family c-di-GMP phosphodiesterase
MPNTTSNIYILCVEDEPEVLDAVIRDLAPFEKTFYIESAASASEARTTVNNVILPRGKLGLVICDHILPGDDGVSFLVELQNNPATATARKVLLTAHAGLEATVEAVNLANLNHYIAKPWQKEDLVRVTRHQLTEFVLENESNLLPFMTTLEADRLTEKIRQTPNLADE